MNPLWIFGGIVLLFLILFLIFFYYRTKWRKQMHHALMINSKLRQSHENGYKYKYRIK